MPLKAEIFFGYPQTKDLAYFLRQSKEWKVAKSIGQSPLIEIQSEQIVYIGLFTPSSSTISELKEIEKKIKFHLQTYCPKINLDHHSIFLISQLLIS